MPPLASVQCSTGPFWAFSLERAFDALAEAGFTQIEMMVTRDPRTQEPDVPKRLADERGLHIASVHGPFLVITRSVWGIEPLGKIRRGVEMCRALGASTYIVHPPYLWERRYAAWCRYEAADYEEETGISIPIETMYPLWVAGRQVRAYRWLDPADLARACHKVALDTSHVTVARRDILESYSTLASKLVHIHLSDNAGDGRDGHLELEQGILPIDRFLGELRRTKYSGAVSLELSVGPYVQKPAELVPMLAKNRDYIVSRLSATARVDKGLPRKLKHAKDPEQPGDGNRGKQKR